MLEALDAWPVNVALLAKGNTVSAPELDERCPRRRLRLQAARGLGHHPGRHRRLPAGAATRCGIQAAIHTDTLNEAGYVDVTLAAIGGRAIHTYHTEGAGGGHAPDIITVASLAPTCCRPRPTRPGPTR